jgi:hypothetical protein
MIKSRRMKREVHVARIGREEIYMAICGKGKRPLGRPDVVRRLILKLI